MKVEWQEINGEQYFNDPVAGWLKKVPSTCRIPEGALFMDESYGPQKEWILTDEAGSPQRFSLLKYAVRCDPPCTLTPQVSLDVCLEYVSYRVSKATKGMQPEVKEAFLQKVFALKQTFALEVEKLLSEVKHG